MSETRFTKFFYDMGRAGALYDDINYLANKAVEDSDGLAIGYAEIPYTNYRVRYDPDAWREGPYSVERIPEEERAS